MYKGILSENNILLGFVNDPDNTVDKFVEVDDADYERYQNLKHNVEFLKYENNHFVLVTNEVENAKILINELRFWFDNYYTVHEQKFNRLIRLGDTSYTKQLKELDDLAEEKRLQIQQLEEVVNGDNN